MGKFVIRRVDSGVKFDLKAENGETIATSEVYSSPAACHKGIESVKKCAAAGKNEDQTEDDFAVLTNPKCEVYRDKAGLFRFRLRSRNGKILAFSEGYTTKAACLVGVHSVIHNAKDAAIE